MISFLNKVKLVTNSPLPRIHPYTIVSKLKMSVGIPIPVANEKLETNNLKRESEESIEEYADISSKKALIETQERIKRRKMAMLISYLGKGYLGLQRNPGTKTIEEDIMVALLKAGFISEEAFQQPQMIQFQRAARTDKGVSALRQILSLKLPEIANTEDINKYLPDQVRAIAIKRVTKGFNCKGNCDARTYSYTTPTFVFTSAYSDETEGYRITPQVQERVRQVLRMYEGTHRFHNFTSKKIPSDPSVKRYIMSFTCEDPFEAEGLEFVTLKVKGQSFMFHQIRKMVGLMIAIVRGFTPDDTVTRAWENDKLDIPIAPGLGLLLEEVHYDRYDQKFGNDGMHETMEWSKWDKQVEEFRQNFILPTVVETEKNEKSMLNWLASLNLHTFDIRLEHIHSELDEAIEKNAGLLSPPSKLDALIAAAQAVETAR